MGALKAPPDGTKLVCVNAQTCYPISEMFDFDKNTGLVSNVLDLATDPVSAGYYGVSFSPDNSKLYISTFINHDRIYQYDLSSGVPATILSSKTVVATNPGGPYFQSMQLGPDGKIYVALWNKSFLGVINNPDSAGAACNYADLSVSLGGRQCSAGLPNFIDYMDYSNTTNLCTMGTDELSIPADISVFPNPFSSEAILKAGTNLVDGSLILYNTLGQTLKRIEHISGEEIRLQRDNLPAGFYYIRLMQDDKIVAAGKLIVD